MTTINKQKPHQAIKVAAVFYVQSFLGLKLLWTLYFVADL